MSVEFKLDMTTKEYLPISITAWDVSFHIGIVKTTTKSYHYILQGYLSL